MCFALDGTGDLQFDYGMICKIVALPASLPAGNTPYVDLLHSGLKHGGSTVQGWRSIGPRQSGDILQVHWPEAVFWNRISSLHESGARRAADRLLTTARNIRDAGGAVVWTIHDLRPHDGLPKGRTEIWGEFFPAFLAQVDAVVSMSRSALTQALEIYPQLRRKPALVAPHPHFRSTLSASCGRAEARRRLGLEDRGAIFCSVGQIRPYKALPALARAFADARTDGMLFIGGNCRDTAIADQLRDAVSDAGRCVRLESRVLSDEEISLIHAASDVAVFNFSAILNSGSVMTALSLDRPVLAPALGSLVETAEVVGPDWMRLADTVTPRVLQEAAAWALLPRGRPDLSAFEPAQMVRQYEAFYRMVLANRRTGEVSREQAAAHA